MPQNSVFLYTSIFAAYNQQDATFYSLSDQYLTLYVQFWAPDDGRKTRLKHVERLAEINKFRKVASCWLYSAYMWAMHGPVNVKFYTPGLQETYSLFAPAWRNQDSAVEDHFLNVFCRGTVCTDSLMVYPQVSKHIRVFIVEMSL